MSVRRIAALTGAVDLVELGSGYATKTGVLLDALKRAGTLERFVPLDVSAPTVHHCANEVAGEFGVPVHGIVGDFERDLGLIPAPIGPRIVAILGGTLGNLQAGSRRHFLSRLRGLQGSLAAKLDLIRSTETTRRRVFSAEEERV